MYFFSKIRTYFVKTFTVNFLNTKKFCMAQTDHQSPITMVVCQAAEFQRMCKLSGNRPLGDIHLTSRGLKSASCQGDESWFSCQRAPYPASHWLRTDLPLKRANRFVSTAASSVNKQIYDSIQANILMKVHF